MKRIGYIHRYSSSEKKGILVYGYNAEPLWNTPTPVLFSTEQCKTAVKTGCLVFFDIDENNVISNIKQASIFNFDKEFMVDLVAVFDSKDWYESKKHTHIRYQNIYELEEFYEYELPSAKAEARLNKEETISNNSIASREEDIDEKEMVDKEESYDESDCDFDYSFDYDNYMTNDEYRKISGPTLIEDEYALFGRQFRSKRYPWWESDPKESHYIYINILDPEYWIQPIPISRKNYYGKNSEECIELFKLLVSKERYSHECYLRNMRYNRRDNLWKLDLATQRALHPELFINDCVSKKWSYLLDRVFSFMFQN